jgi:hypothetical protein
VARNEMNEIKRMNEGITAASRKTQKAISNPMYDDEKSRRD